MNRKFDGYLLDLDGTLWDTTEATWHIWCDVLRENGYAPVTRQAVKDIMGLPMNALLDQLLCHVPPQERARIGKACMDYENEYLRTHGGVLYPTVKETVTTLSKTAAVTIVSNAPKGYIEAFLEAHGLDGAITDHLCFGDNGKLKAENIRLMVDKHGFQHPLYVGDTALDRQSAQSAEVPFVFAAYGLGSIPDAEVCIGKLGDLLRLNVNLTFSE